jgi:hypothetical protein
MGVGFQKGDLRPGRPAATTGFHNPFKVTDPCITTRGAQVSTIERLRAQARRLGHIYPHLLQSEHDRPHAGDDQEPEAEEMSQQLQHKGWLRELRTEIRHGAAHRAAEAEMLANMKR